MMKHVNSLAVLLAMSALYASHAAAAPVCEQPFEGRLYGSSKVHRIPVHMPIGAPLTEWTTSGQVHIGTCDTRYAKPGTVITPGLEAVDVYEDASGVYSVFPTGVEGMGMILRVKDLYSRAGYVPVHDKKTRISESGDGDVYRSHYLNAHYRYVKTGAMMAGNQKTTNVTLLSALMDGGSINSTAVKLGENTMSVFENPQCNVTTRRVNIGSVQLSEFEGSRTSASRNFPIELSCTGVPGQVNYEFTTKDVRTLDPKLGLIELDNPTDDGTAKGIGLQLLHDNGTPIEMDTSYVFSSHVTPGPVSKDFKVRYYKTTPDAVVTAGRGDATAKVLLLYP